MHSWKTKGRKTERKGQQRKGERKREKKKNEEERVGIGRERERGGRRNREYWLQKRKNSISISKVLGRGLKEKLIIG